MDTYPHSSSFLLVVSSTNMLEMYSELSEISNTHQKKCASIVLKKHIQAISI